MLFRSWSKGIEEHKHVGSVGGKGGGGGTKTTYSYTCTFAVEICAGPIAGVKRIWADSKLIYDRKKTDDPWAAYQNYLNSTAKSESIAIYTGTETQNPDPIMESVEGTGNVPGYRGLAYIVFEDLELNDFGRRIPNLEFEVAAGTDADDVIRNSPIGAANTIDYIPYTGNFMFSQAGNIYFYDKNFNLLNKIEIGDVDGASAIYYSLALVNVGGSELRWISLATGGITKTLTGITVNATSMTVGYSDTLGRKVIVCWANPVRVFDYIDAYAATSAASFPEPLVTFDYSSVDDLAFYDGQLYYFYKSSYNAYLYKVNILTGELYDGIDFFNITAPGNYFHVITFTANGDLILVFENELHLMEGISNTPKSIVTLLDGAENPAQVDSIVSEIFEDCGLAASDYDVSELSGDTVIGYIQTDPMAGRDLIKPLMRAYQFDVVEQDWQVVCRKRGSSSVADIPWDDLAAREAGSEAPEPLIESIADETEMPLELELEYRDYDTDYQPAVERAKRSTSTINTENKKKLRYPIIMQSTQALQAVETLFETTWVQRKSYQLQAPTDYIKLTPGDVLTVANTYKLIADEVTVSFPLIVKMKAFAEDSASYTSNSTGVAPYATPQTLTSIAPVFPVFIDVPALEGYATQLSFYLAAFALEEGWKLSVVYRSLDNGQTWDQIAAVENMSTVGRTTDALSDGPVTVLDYGNTVNVDLRSYNSSLSGASLLSIFSGTNTAAIGADDRWEIISFSEVTEEADGTFTLSKLVRGRKGTDHNTGNHAAGDTFALLESGKLIWVPVPESKLDASVTYKIVPVSKSLQAAAAIDFTCDGKALMPYSPVHITGARDGSDNLTIEWVRRSRAMIPWRAPLLEETEKYEIDIYDGSTVVRTITVTGATSTTYSAADQTTDFGSAQSSITLKIYQISATVGRGFGREATL